MRTTNRILGVALLMAVFLISNQVAAQEQSQRDSPPGDKQELLVEVPDLADIIPLATELSGRLAALENNVVDLSKNVSEFEQKFSVIEENLGRPYDELQQLKDKKDYKYKKLLTLREEIKREIKLFDEISSPLSKNIRQVGAWRKEWLEEKKRWNEWQSSMIQEGTFDQLKSVFAKANETIDRALNILLPQLESMLTIQAKAGNIETKIYTLDGELQRLLLTGRRSDLVDPSFSMYSSEYFSQYKSALWYAVLRGLGEAELPVSHFFVRSGWVFFLQAFLALFTTIKVYRNRQVLKDTTRWQLIAARPVSAGLFFSAMVTMGLYLYTGSSPVYDFVLSSVAAISLARLVGGSNQPSEKTQFVYGLIIFFLVIRLFELVSLPLPLFRLSIVLIALVGQVFCSRWALASGRRKDSGLYTRSLRLISLFLVVVIIAEVFGKHGPAFYLLISSLITTLMVIAFLLFRFLIFGALEWLFSTSFLRRSAVLLKDTNTIIKKAGVFVDIVIWGLLLLPGILLIWRVYDTLGEAIQGVLTFGFELGSQRISVGLVVTAAGILYATFIASWISQKLLIDQVLARRNVEMGVRFAMASLVHYVILFVGFLLALSALGVEVTKLTIMLSALSVGIGFGLQGVANNFVSGIILLFERPVRVGDLVQMGDQWATIKRIGLRSTTVITVEDSEVIVPNANLVNNEVINWTRSNRRARFEILVGVAYGSDVSLVIETLMACVKEHPKVAKTHEPQVLFQSFGESSLDFALRAWVYDINYRLTTSSELRQEIDRKFREAKIVIAFPQRDLHFCSMDESINLRPQETTK